MPCILYFYDRILQYSRCVFAMLYFYPWINPNEGIWLSLGEDVTEIQVDEVFPSCFPSNPWHCQLKSWEWMGLVLTVGGTMSANPCAWVIHGSRMHSLWLGMAPPPHKGINTRAPRAWGLDSVGLVALDQPPQANQMTSWLSLPGHPALGSSELPWWSLRKGCLSIYFRCLVALRLT